MSKTVLTTISIGQDLYDAIPSTPKTKYMNAACLALVKTCQREGIPMYRLTCNQDHYNRKTVAYRMPVMAWELCEMRGYNKTRFVNYAIQHYDPENDLCTEYVRNIRV